MKKYLVVLGLTFMVAFAFGLPFTYAQKTDHQPQPDKTVQLTEQQKAELAQLYQQMVEKKKEIITKKVEFGMISKEKGDKMISHIDKHFEMLKENNFMFHCDIAKKYHFHKHHDE